MNKSIREMIQEYREAAAKHRAATSGGDYKAANQNYDKLVALISEIRETGRAGAESLLALVHIQIDIQDMLADKSVKSRRR